MRKHEIYLPELVLVGATRGMLGAGIGLLVANQLSNDHRRIVGTALLAVGALSTIPLALRLFRRKPEISAEARAPRRTAASMMTH
jgi:uncharacterized membrane protein YfcA